MYQAKLIAHAQRDLDSLPKNIFTRIIKEIRVLEANPRLHGSIKLTQSEGYRARIGDYRILYRINDASKIIYIYRIKHRREAYR